MSGNAAKKNVPALEELRAKGILRDLDVVLVQSLIRTCADGKEPAAIIRVLLALASRASGDGHVCLNLDREDWTSLLRGSRDEETASPANDMNDLLPFTPADALKALAGANVLIGAGGDHRPFVLENRRLYLRRFWNYEQDVATRLRKMAAGSVSAASGDVESFLKTHGQSMYEGQKEAIRKVASHRLVIITGGPGTGKTYVAAQALKYLAATNASMRVRMAAPTGKAAARMDESVNHTLGDASDFALHREPACTLDRLLGYRVGSPYFRHHRDHPLAADVVLIDEASMIDLPKMAKLLEAIGEGTRLILLGDKDQLASVEPGSVMAGICSAPALTGYMVTLTENRRFGAESQVAKLSRAVNDGDADAAFAQLRSGGADAAIRMFASGDFRPDDPPVEFKEQIKRGFGEFLAAKEPAEVFKALAKFRVLCALKRGPQGAARLNRVIEDILCPSRKGEFYDHRVILVTRNEYEVNLFNGDVGVVLKEGEGEPVALFESAGGIRPVPCRLLPEHETAFAMTVHKAQGSGFGQVLVFLPGEYSPVMTRELIYTAITRAETHVDLWCEETAFKQAVQTRTVRSMGLEQRLG
jgi:exodeoxyribonuclease V alpha subunit